MSRRGPPGSGSTPCQCCLVISRMTGLHSERVRSRRRWSVLGDLVLHLVDQVVGLVLGALQELLDLACLLVGFAFLLRSSLSVRSPTACFTLPLTRSLLSMTTPFLRRVAPHVAEFALTIRAWNPHRPPVDDRGCSVRTSPPRGQDAPSRHRRINTIATMIRMSTTTPPPMYMVTPLF